MNRRFISKTIIFVLLCSISFSYLSAQNPAPPSLLEIIANGNIQQVQAAISSGININAPLNELGWTALHASVVFRQVEIVKLLLQSHADINVRDTLDETPLYLAVETGQLDIVNFFISNGADVNIVNKNGDNALSLSQKIGLNAISSTLLSNNAVSPTAVPTNTTRGNRRGVGPRGLIPNQIIPNVETNTDITNPEPAPNFNIPVNPNVTVSEINLDPNEVKARLQKYDGLEKEVEDVAGNSRLGMRQWLRSEENNKDRLLSAVRRQYEDEIEFIKKTAEQEKAQNTIKAASELFSTEKTKFATITKEVRDQMAQQDRQNRGTTTSTSRSSRGRNTTTMTTTRSTTRSSRRSTNTVTDTQPVTTEATTEKKYEPETQSVVDTWLDADVETITGRIDLMNTVNNRIYSQLDSIKNIANGEKAEKTVAVIDGLLIARQKRYNDAQQELEKLSQKQGVQTTTEIPETTNTLRGRGQMMEPGNQNTTTGRAGSRRGR